MLKIENKNVLVTGGGSGIGLAIVQALSSCPSNTVYVLDQHEHLLDAIEGDNVVRIRADLTDWDGTRAALEDKLPRVVHCLVNNAGVGGKGGVLEVDEALLDRIMAVNTRAIVNVSQVVASRFISSGCGGYCSIVNVSSLASRFPTRVSVAYNLSKAAVDMLTKSMALELGPYNIRVNSVNPGIVLGTDLSSAWVGAYGEALKARLMARTPLNRCVDVGHVVSAVLFLLWDAGVRMVHGESLVVDGGYSVA